MDEEIDILDSTLSESINKDEEEINIKKVPNDERISRGYLTKFEKAKIIGTRAVQLSRGATSKINTAGMTNTRIIAEKELYEKKTPFIIRRYMPSGYYEDWDIKELIIK